MIYLEVHIITVLAGILKEKPIISFSANVDYRQHCTILTTSQVRKMETQISLNWFALRITTNIT